MKSDSLHRLASGPVLRTVLSTVGLATLVTSAQAASVNLVSNGGFEETLAPGSRLLYPCWDALTDWTVGNPSVFSGYIWVYQPGTADTSGALGPLPGQAWAVWGPHDGSANGLPASSPVGGNFLALDGDPVLRVPLSQTINGLILGQTYTLSFYWAGAQQVGVDGATTDQFQVSLGSETQFTTVIDNASHGFTGWQKDSLTFTPTSTTELLSFLAISTPAGIPPYVLLDGVSLTQVTPTPEPASWALLLITGVGLAGLARTRRKTGAWKN